MTLLPVSAAHDYPSFEDHGGDQSRLDRVPVMVGIAMFFSSIGFGVPLPKVFYIQALLCPMIVAAAYLLSIREQRIGAVRINLAIAMMATWMVFSMGWTLAPSTRDAATTALLPITTSMTLALG